MTRQEALDLTPPVSWIYVRTITGTDGETWYWSEGGEVAEWTAPLYVDDLGIVQPRLEPCPIEPPPGRYGPVDWVPGRMEPPACWVVAHWPRDLPVPNDLRALCAGERAEWRGKR